jgi:hypothetical protein
VFTIKPPPSTISDGAIFRLASLVPGDRPMVDKNMRPLLPLRFSFHFAVVKTGTTFAITAPPITP